jgi:hypothetical protein
MIFTVPLTKAEKHQYGVHSKFNAVNELTKDICKRGLEKLLILFKKLPACCAT